MVITQATLNALRRTFDRLFQTGIQSAASEWKKVATRVPSGSAQNIYGWLMKFPQMREWPKGSRRQLRDIAEKAYALANRKFESTVPVEREDIEDDNLGLYRPLVEATGQEALDHVDRGVFGVLDNGYRTTCFDGKAFFAADHPRYTKVDGTGVNEPESNLIKGELEVVEPTGKTSAGDLTIVGGGARKAVGGTFRIKCVKAGASRTAAKFRLAYDDEEYGGADLTLSAGKYEIPDGGGVKVAFTDAAYVKDEEWTFKPKYAPWYLLHTRSVLRPLIYQDRDAAKIEVVMNPQNDTVFHADQYLYGVRARRAFGVAFWQMAVCSTEELGEEAFRKARQRMMEIKWDGGQRTGFRPTLLAVGPGLLASAETTIKAQFGTGGKTNTLYNTVEVCDSSWLR